MKRDYENEKIKSILPLIEKMFMVCDETSQIHLSYIEDEEIVHAKIFGRDKYINVKLDSVLSFIYDTVEQIYREML